MREEVKSPNMRASPQEIRPEGSQFVSCEFVRVVATRLSIVSLSKMVKSCERYETPSPKSCLAPHTVDGNFYP